MRRAALLLAIAAGPYLAVPAVAQTTTLPAEQTAPILVFDQQLLFTESLFGKAVLARRQASEDALIAENLRIEQALEAEEKDLTARRATLPAAEFRALADAFDVKVEGVRAAQRAKYDEITAVFEADQQAFFDVAVPIIRTLMRDAGAVVVMDKNTIFMSLERIDVTAVAIARLDAEVGDGSGLADPQPPPQP
ncbi:MAG: OmpH family outer membrane protein [Paracoccaceae bacterium]